MSAFSEKKSLKIKTSSIDDSTPIEQQVKSDSDDSLTPTSDSPGKPKRTNSFRVVANMVRTVIRSPSFRLKKKKPLENYPSEIDSPVPTAKVIEKKKSERSSFSPMRSNKQSTSEKQTASTKKSVSSKQTLSDKQSASAKLPTNSKQLSSEKQSTSNKQLSSNRTSKKIEPPKIVVKRPKSPRFNENLNSVHEVMALDDYIEQKLLNDVWWNRDELRLITKQTRSEIADYLRKTKTRDVSNARSNLYQPTQEELLV